MSVPIGSYECNFTWRDSPNGIVRRCTRILGHAGRHEEHGEPDGPAKLTLTAWRDESPADKVPKPNDVVTIVGDPHALPPERPDVQYGAEPKVKRVPVDYLWSKLNWDFLKLLAQIAQYAEEKYGSAEQYMNARLTGEKDPINHAYEHLRKYQAGEPHDKFGDVKWHLAAAAYNLMMAAAADARWGYVPNPVMAKTREKP